MDSKFKNRLVVAVLLTTCAIAPAKAIDTWTELSNAVASGGNVSINSPIIAEGAIVNQAITKIEGGSIDGNGQYRTFANYGDLTLNNTSITNSNGSTGGGTGYTPGGAINNYGELTISNSVISGNTTSNRGGAINNESGNLYINNTTFENNSVTDPSGYGGAIYNQNKTVTIGEGSKFINNSAAGGGAIFNDYNVYEPVTGPGHVDGTVLLTIKDNVEFTDNHATTKHSGAILNQSQVLIGNGVKFTGNTANWYGGAISQLKASTDVRPDSADKVFTHIGNGVLFDNNSVSGQAWSSGGAIYNEYGKFTIGTGSLFNNNSATATGGAIVNAANMTIANGAAFTNNRSGAFGGAIYNTGEMTFDGDASYKGNTAGVHGGAIYNQGGTIDFNGNVLFDGNKAGGMGALANVKGGTVNIKGAAVFQNNAATDVNGGGGAIYNQDSNLTIGNNAVFNKNNGGRRGGAIYQETTNQALPGQTNTTNTASTTIGSGATFVNNEAAGSGAIYNYALTDTSKIIIGENALFQGNKATSGDAGAIGNFDGIIEIGSSSFVSNTATGSGGAIYNTGEMTFDGQTVFDGNKAGNKGGAIFNAGTINFKNSVKDIVFQNNTADGKANDIFMADNSTLNFEGMRNVYINGGISSADNTAIINNASNLVLGGNSGDYKGVYNQTEGKTNVNGIFFGGESNISDKNTILNFNEGSQFIAGSTVNMSGGAIMNIADGVISEMGSKINLDKSSINFNNQKDMNLYSAISGDVDSRIFKDKDGNVYLYADNSGFVGITEIKGNGIFEVKDGGVMLGGEMKYTHGSQTVVISDNVPLQNLNSANVLVTPQNGAGISFDDKVTSTNNSVLIAKAENNGAIDFKGTVEQNAGSILVAEAKNSDVNFKEDVTITDSALQTNAQNTIFDKSLTLSNGIFNVTQGGFSVGQDLTVGSMVNTINGTINQNNIAGNLLVGTSGDGQFAVDLDTRAQTSDTINVAGDVGLSPDAIAGGLTQGSVTINDFNLLNAPMDRNLKFKIFNIDGTVASDVNFAATDRQIMTPIGNYQLSSLGNGTFGLDLTSFNPQVFRAQASTVAQYANQLVTNNMVLDHAAIVSGQFLAEDKTANQYAAINPLFAPYQYSRKDGGLWYKAYGNFETISMTQGLNVRNNAYGSLIGADFPLMNLKNGWKLIPTAYLGYNGAHQTFNGVSMYQNGGQLGLMGTAFKGDLFTSLLAYAGGYANDMSVPGYSDTTGNWFAGVASKTAYNIHMPKDFILQPSMMLAYNAFGSQNFHSNYGALGMNAGMLNGINVAPGVNLIWNKKTFSLYATTQMVFNIMGEVSGKAGNVTLPTVEMRHAYFEYGVGAMKKFKDRFVGYVQITVRNGGRTGVGFQGGIQFRI